MLSSDLNKQGKPIFEVHTWEKLSPFINIAKMIDIMTFFIKLMLIAIVLISIMNVMIMAVYERIREIGTIAAIGTMPEKILSLFLIEGFSLGIFGAIIGNIFALIIVYILNISRITFNFGRQTGLILSPMIKVSDILLVSIIVIFVSVIASLQPAFKASRMEPIKALKHL
jgi:putative ABC transport system permease protein